MKPTEETKRNIDELAVESMTPEERDAWKKKRQREKGAGFGSAPPANTSKSSSPAQRGGGGFVDEG